MQLLRTCNNRDSEFSDLAAIIDKDAGLSAKMLKVANSPLYAQWGEITDLNRMLVVLGLHTIKIIAIASSVCELFSKLNPGNSRFLALFWRHSLLCAHLATNLARHLGCRNPDEAYLAGLLHKLGQLVLFNNDRNAYQTLLDKAPSPERLRREELQLFGISHDTLGAWLLSRWQLSRLVTDAVLYQQATGTSMSDAPDLVKIIGVSSKLSDPRQRDSAMSDASLLFRLQVEDLSPLIDKADNEIQQTAESLGVVLGASEADPVPVAEAPGSSNPELAQLVRDSALLESAKSAMREISNSQDPYAVIPVFLNILFDLDKAVFFLEDRNKRIRGKVPGEKSRWVDELKIQMEPNRSLLCDAFLSKCPLDSFEYESSKGTLTVVDRQLIHYFETEGLLAMPLIAKEHSLGILAIGLDRSTLKHLQPRRNLLDMFVTEAAQLLLSLRDEAQTRQRLVAEREASVLLHSRKVRHEVNNPLGIIKNYLYILGSQLGEGHHALRELGIIREEINRVGKILHGLTDYAPPTGIPEGLLDLNDTISELLAVLRPSVFEPRSIRIAFQADQTIPALQADRDKLKQIILNLLKNAYEALGEGGRIKIHTQDGIFGEGDSFVEIGIRDTGPGLPAQIRKKLFQPVSSTKGEGHSGLGLSITYRLVQDLKGVIRCRTGSGGTEFLVLIPRRTQALVEEQRSGT